MISNSKRQFFIIMHAGVSREIILCLFNTVNPEIKNIVVNQFHTK